MQDVTLLLALAELQLLQLVATILTRPPVGFPAAGGLFHFKKVRLPVKTLISACPLNAAIGAKDESVPQVSAKYIRTVTLPRALQQDGRRI